MADAAQTEADGAAIKKQQNGALILLDYLYACWRPKIEEAFLPADQKRGTE